MKPFNIMDLIEDILRVLHIRNRGQFFPIKDSSVTLEVLANSGVRVPILILSIVTSIIVLALMRRLRRRKINPPNLTNRVPTCEDTVNDRHGGIQTKGQIGNLNGRHPIVEPRLVYFDGSIVCHNYAPSKPRVMPPKSKHLYYVVVALMSI